jgi:hypothetical protein
MHRFTLILVATAAGASALTWTNAVAYFRTAYLAAH